MSEHEYIPYEISVEPADPWMVRPIEVRLTTWVTEKAANTQAFRVDEAEARDLIQKLTTAGDRGEFTITRMQLVEMEATTMHAVGVLLEAEAERRGIALSVQGNPDGSVTVKWWTEARS